MDIDFKFYNFTPADDLKKIKESLYLWLGEHMDIITARLAHTDPNIKTSFKLPIKLFYNYKNQDMYVRVFATPKGMDILIFLLNTLEDIPLKSGLKFTDMPMDMYVRLFEKTRDIEVILLENKQLKHKIESYKKM